MKRFLICATTLLLGWNPLWGEVTVELERQPIAIKTGEYTARIEPDGCLTNLAVGGINLLAPGVSISRGSYFYQAGPLKLTNVERLEGNVVTAGSDAAAVRYEFGEKQVSARLTNRSDQSMVFFVVFNGIVEAFATEDGLLQESVIQGQHSQVRAFLGKYQLIVAGFDKLWGPWQGPHQVVETSLAPGESKTLSFQIAAASQEQRLEILDLKALPPEAELTISSPRDYQVIQRLSKSSGRVLISGRTRTDASQLELRLSGEGLSPNMQQWQSIPLQQETQKFSSWIDLPAGGWYRLEARAIRGDETLAEATVGHFGVGDIFVGAGQSNSTNSGQFKTKQTTGMVSSFSGTDWQLADDPQPGVADRSQGGSFWPAFGDLMHRKLGVPIGVATTGYGGTSVNQWQPDGDLFQRWLLKRIHQLGPQGFRAVLWHQGESDVGMSSEEYYGKLKNTILTSIKQAGWEFPWFVAQASYHNAQKPRFESVRSAQKRLWDEGVAERGPDTDELGGDHRDFDGKGIHFSPKGLKVHGELWAEKLAAYVEGELASQSDKSAPPEE